MRVSAPWIRLENDKGEFLAVSHHHRAGERKRQTMRVIAIATIAKTAASTVVIGGVMLGLPGPPTRRGHNVRRSRRRGQILALPAILGRVLMLSADMIGELTGVEPSEGRQWRIPFSRCDRRRRSREIWGWELAFGGA
jgi:hypothetical protein